MLDALATAALAVSTSTLGPVTICTIKCSWSFNAIVHTAVGTSTGFHRPNSTFVWTAGGTSPTVDTVSVPTVPSIGEPPKPLISKKSGFKASTTIATEVRSVLTSAPTAAHPTSGSESNPLTASVVSVLVMVFVLIATITW